MTPADPLCRTCRERPKRGGGWPRCNRCHQWYYSHGYTERPATMPSRRRYAAGATCVICLEVAAALTRDRCPRCYAYRWRHGVDRPARVDQLGTARPCRHRECGTITRKLTRGFCSKHYLRLWRRGLPPLARAS